MNLYNPDNWVLIKIEDNDEIFYKLLVGWSGGYLTGDSWRCSSAIKSISTEENNFLFKSQNGSIYNCHKEAYGLRMNNAYIWDKLQRFYGNKISLMPETSNWETIMYGVSDNTTADTK